MSEFGDLGGTGAAAVARGHNLVAVTPPAAAYATPVLEALLGRLGKEGGALLLCPPAEIDTWGALVHSVAEGRGLRVQVARGEARATRRLRAEPFDLLVASPEAALALLRRSLLKIGSVAAVVLAWPERLDDGDTLTHLMNDLPKDAQRVLVTALPEQAADLVERYARKALTVGLTGPVEAPVGPVRTASVSWERRAGALSDLVELLDPDSVVIWAADRSHEAAIGRAVAFADSRLVTGDAPTADLVIAFDLPSAARLRQLREAGEVVLLVPPGTEAYAMRIAAPRRPIRLPGALDTVTQEGAKRRSAIVQAIDERSADAALLTLAPLFERHDAVTVAAALYELWLGSGGSAPPATPEAAPAAAAPAAMPVVARIWVGLGKKDKVTANDFVGVMTKELRIDRTQIGRIELQEGFSLIEVPGTEAERIARALSSATIKKKRISARLDRASPRASAGGSRRP